MESGFKLGGESSNEPNKDGKGKREQKPANSGRWLQPPLPRVNSEAMFAEGGRKNFNETFVRAPLPWEKPGEKPPSSAAETKDDDDDEEKKEDEDTGTNESVAAESESESEVETAEGSPEATTETAALLEQEPAPDTSAEPEPDLQEVFETISQPEPLEQLPAAEYQGHLSVPHDEAPHEIPTVPLTAEERRKFDEQMSHDVSADYTEATSGEELGVPDKDTIPSWYDPTVPHPLGPREAAPAANVGGPAETQPFPPNSPTGFIDRYVPVPGSSPEMPRTDAGSPERSRDANRPLVNRVVMTVAVAGYLAGRRMERYRNEPLLREQRKATAELLEEQRRTNEYLRQLKNEAQETAEAVAAVEEDIYDQNGNRIILQPGQRIERSAGGYSVVLDEHNRVVHDAIRYGEAFKREQQREQLSDDIFVAAGGIPTGQDAGDDTALPTAGQHITPGQQTSGQQPLIDQPHQVDINHRLPEPHKRLSDAALNPWLWTAVAFLIIVYFLAALA